MTKETTTVKNIDTGKITPDVVEAWGKADAASVSARLKLATEFWEKHPELNFADVAALAEDSNKGFICC